MFLVATLISLVVMSYFMKSMDTTTSKEIPYNEFVTMLEAGEVESVFIAADEEDKIPWLMDMYGFDEHKARDFMLKADKRRASYYNYYTNKKWGAVSSYDLCLNTSAIGRERCADIIMEFAKKKEAFLNAGRVDSFANYFKDKK